VHGCITPATRATAELLSGKLRTACCACRAPTPESLLTSAGQFNIQFKEISADKLQAVAPQQRAEVEAVRMAMGSEHAKQLQAETSGALWPAAAWLHHGVM
jgi:hypothetical protein